MGPMPMGPMPTGPMPMGPMLMHSLELFRKSKATSSAEAPDSATA